MVLKGSKNISVKFPVLIKNSSIFFIIAFLALLLFKLLETFVVTPLPLPSSEKPVELYSNQTDGDLQRLYLQAIKEAKHSITIVIFSLYDKKIIQALRDRSDQNISVYIVCDATATPSLQNKIPNAKIIARSGEGLTHQKILIVDNSKIWIGSANLTHDSLFVHANLVVGIENRALAEMLSKKIMGMQVDGSDVSPLTHQIVKMDSQVVELWILPDDRRAVNRLIKLFRSAQKSIKVAMFTWTRFDFAQELIQAAKRGVNVEVVIDRSSGKGASAGIVSQLLKHQVFVRLSTTKGLLHHKFVYVDEEILVNGSANWTNAAFKYNDDCFVIVYPLTLQQQRKINTLWSLILKNS